jgi:hypothetical protein
MSGNERLAANIAVVMGLQMSSRHAGFGSHRVIRHAQDTFLLEAVPLPSTAFLRVALLYLLVADSIAFPSGWLYPKQSV